MLPKGVKMKVNLKRGIAAILILVILLSFSGCAKADTIVTEERAKAVKVQTAALTAKNNTILYIGTVDAKELTNISSKVGGKVKAVYVEKGDYVEKGSKLFEIDGTDLKFQVDAAKAQLDAANLNIVKAKDSLDYSQNLYNQMKDLYDSNSISKDQYDQVKLQFDTASTTYNQAAAQYNAAKADYDYKKSMIEDTVVVADVSGRIVSIDISENERIGTGGVAMSIRSDVQVINIGIPQSDLNQVTVGSKATVDVDGEVGVGTLTYISEAPDRATRTYNAEVEVSDKIFRLGSIGKVKIDLGKEQGIWIPISSIFANGEDYVYIIKDSRAFKRTIEILAIDNEVALIKGIEVGEQLAISGMKNLNDGSKVNVVE